MLASLIGLGFVVTAACTPLSARDATSATVPFSAPASAATLAHSLVSISIEGDRWPDWAGSTSARNQFFYNVLTNLGKLTGRMPNVRVGANSEDKTQFNSAVNVRLFSYSLIICLLTYTYTGHPRNLSCSFCYPTIS